MANKLLVLLVVLSLCVVVFPHQSVNGWEKSYDGPSHGDDYATAILKDDQGQVYVTGYSWSSQTSYDYVTVKYSFIGSTFWSRRYDGAGHGADIAEAIVMDQYGYVYVTGRSQGGELDYDYLTIRYEPDGDIAEGWPQTYDGPEKGNDEACALALDGDGNVYVTGRSIGEETGYDYTTIKYTPTGDTSWARRYDGEANARDEACAIAVDGSGNVYVTGKSRSIDSNYDFVTIKYEPDGDVAEGWPKIYDRDKYQDEARAIAVDDSGCVYVTGRSYAEETLYDYVTIKYYPTGEYWVKVYDGPAHGTDAAEAIAIDPQGNVCVTGRSQGSGSGFDYATVKYEPDGGIAEEWPRRYEGKNADKAHGIAVDDSSNVYVTGESYGDESSYDYLTIMYRPDGSVPDGWPKRWNGPGNGGDGAVSIAVGLFNYVYITGAGDGGETSSDYTTIKYLESYHGDVDGDHDTDWDDLTYLWEYLFKYGPPPDPVQRGDVNCSELVNQADWIYLRDYLRGVGPPPCE